MAAASMPGNEDANLMAAVISFFVLLGTIRYWMSLSSKAENKKAENKKSLLKAAEDGDMHKVASLIKAGTDVVCKNGAGNTAVELAQNAQTIDLLKGAGVTMPEFPEEEKIDLLIEYAKKGLAGGALMAIQAGEDVNHKDKAGNTAVELAQNAQTIDLLKGEGTTMPEFPEEKKNNLLIEYAKKGATGGALMAIQAGADVNHKGSGGYTPLHYTARDNKPEVAKVLLANGAQVNVGDNGGRTALRVAREFDSFGRWSPLVGNPEMEALLRQHGAEIEVMPPTIRSENTSARRAMHCTFVQIANAAGGLGSAMMNFFTLIISLLPNLGVRIVNIFALATDVLIAICILLVRGFGDFLVIGILFPNASAVAKEF